MDNQEQYERALKRAEDEGIVIVGDSVAPNGNKAWNVYNPRHDSGFYTVRLAAGAAQYTCNCVAGSHGKLCKHQAIVIRDQARQRERRATDLSKWTVDSLAAARIHDPNTVVPLSLWR
jgi:hypothetical protein